jgi:ABC-type multidrug transport system fused ATPase/permease subunit
MFAMIGFLFRHLKGYRALVIFATLMTITQVGSDILAGFPIKFITDQIQGKSPPEALDQFIEWFNGLAQGNRPTRVILFSIAALLVLSAVSALLSYIQRVLASFIGQNLAARLRRTLFEH